MRACRPSTSARLRPLSRAARNPTRSMPHVRRRVLVSDRRRRPTAVREAAIANAWRRARCPTARSSGRCSTMTAPARRSACASTAVPADPTVATRRRLEHARSRTSGGSSGSSCGSWHAGVLDDAATRLRAGVAGDPVPAAPAPPHAHPGVVHRRASRPPRRARGRRRGRQLRRRAAHAERRRRHRLVRPRRRGPRVRARDRAGRCARRPGRGIARRPLRPSAPDPRSASAACASPTASPRSPRPSRCSPRHRCSPERSPTHLRRSPRSPRSRTPPRALAPSRSRCSGSRLGLGFGGVRVPAPHSPTSVTTAGASRSR